MFGALSISPRDIFFVVVAILATRAAATLLGLVVIGLLVFAALSTLGWSRRTWQFDGSHFRLEEGVLARRVRDLPVDRIQRIEIERKVRHQILGMATLKIETAGASRESEVKLEVVPVALAQELRQALLAARDATRTTESVADVGAGGRGAHRSAPDISAAEPPVVPIVRLGISRLALAGMTGRHLFAVVLVAGWLLNAFVDAPAALQPNVDANDLRFSGIAVAALVVIVVAVAWMVIAAVASVVTYFEFRVDRRGSELRLERGLLNRRESSVPIARVQSVQLSQGLLKRPLGLYVMHIASAGATDSADDKTTIPAVNRAEADAVLAVLLPSASPLPVLSPAPRRALRRHVLRWTLPAALVAALAWRFLGERGSAALPLVAIGAGLGLLAWRGLGWYAGDDLIIGRHGALNRVIDVVPKAKIQSARRSSSMFQRRRRLATLHLDVAAHRRAPAIEDQDEEVVETLLVERGVTNRGRADDAALRRFTL